MTDREIEAKIREFFDSNYEILQLESGHSISEDGKQMALNQVLCYWRKLKEIAENVTDTEVRLSLPDRRTPGGRTYSIEGVVDIVKEKGETWMYDIKTHEPDYIRANIEFYEDQINVYAHIWQHLRGNTLDRTAVISTAYPKGIREALYYGDEAKLAKEMEKWAPVIEVPSVPEKVERTIEDFGRVVDMIEESEFAPPPKGKLEEKMPGSSRAFAVQVCRNCDARFSCESFRQYALDPKRRGGIEFVKYVEQAGDDLDQEAWVNANLETLTERIEDLKK